MTDRDRWIEGWQAYYYGAVTDRRAARRLARRAPAWFHGWACARLAEGLGRATREELATEAELAWEAWRPTWERIAVRLAPASSGGN